MTSNEKKLSKYDIDATEHPAIDLSSISSEDKKSLEEVGVDFDNIKQTRTATFIQKDQSVINIDQQNEGLEILDINTALKKYDWLREEYLWKSVSPDKDEYTEAAHKFPVQGYFIRASKGYKGGNIPVQSCLYIAQDNLMQRVHNIIIAEEGAELNIINGCTTSVTVKEGAHLGITEYYVKKDAKLTFTMIHSWGENVLVRPRSAGVVEENGLFISNFISLKPVKSIQSYPSIKCNGKNATARFYSVVASFEGNELDLGAEVVLNGEASSGEIISRAVCHGGNIIARGRIIGNGKRCKGHLECDGLILHEEGTISAIPELHGNTNNAELSHEAAVGRIGQEKINYLQARGLTEEEAVNAIVTGFISLDIPGIPDSLNDKIEEAINSYGDAMF
ncbi:MAG: SufD family Fe-S cluster assembly protein [Candidatus Heimdallarchaeota archaeon]|nr:SufD family Fe-S cluster assembly protein [Candidatus Heimdallarchaeota archaeon]MCK5049414.1 SufD family Fe-S cluster assembly protein [Candidatus Heimdallarchaeota archaeon]